MDYNELVELVLRQSNNTISRKVLETDIDHIAVNNLIKEDKLKSYRMQGEYGQKKFIKP